MKYFRESENPTARLPQDFMQGFLEVGSAVPRIRHYLANAHLIGAKLMCLGVTWSIVLEIK